MVKQLAYKKIKNILVSSIIMEFAASSRYCSYDGAFYSKLILKKKQGAKFFFNKALPSISVNTNILKFPLFINLFSSLKSITLCFNTRSVLHKNFYFFLNRYQLLYSNTFLILFDFKIIYVKIQKCLKFFLFLHILRLRG